MTPERIAALIAQFGQPVTLQRLTGTTTQVRHDVVCQAIVRGYELADSCRWTRYGHTWIMSATEAAKLDTSLTRREIIRALERDLVVVLEKPGWTVIMFADNRGAFAIIPRGKPQRLSVTRASEYLGFSASAKSYVHADLGARAWHQLVTH